MAHNLYNHREEWSIRVAPDPGETWPRATVPGRGGYEFQPTVIHLHARRNVGLTIGLLGVRVRKDGTPGKLRAGSHQPLPEWAAKLMDAARDEHGLSDDYLRKNGVEI